MYREQSEALRWRATLMGNAGYRYTQFQSVQYVTEEGVRSTPDYSRSLKWTLE
jgi:hypothetical protein